MRWWGTAKRGSCFWPLIPQLQIQVRAVPCAAMALCVCVCVCLCCPSGPALETGDKTAVPLRGVSDALGPPGSLDGRSPTRGAAWGGGRSTALCSMCCARSHHAAFQKGFRDGAGVWQRLFNGPRASPPSATPTLGSPSQRLLPQHLCEPRAP